jgi:hypothetical protein
MTTAVRELMDSFEALSKIEQQQAVAEILRRAAFEIDDLGDAGLSEIADELFQSLDTAEAVDNGRS